MNQVDLTGKMVKTYVKIHGKYPPSSTYNDYNRILWIPFSTLMAVIFWVITSSSLKTKMVFMRPKMSSNSWITVFKSTCVYLCINVHEHVWAMCVCVRACVCVCVWHSKQQLVLKSMCQCDSLYF